MSFGTAILLIVLGAINMYAQGKTQAMNNEIFKIQGLKVGQVQDTVGMTGCTALIFEEGAVASVDVRGSAPGTREIALLEPGNLVEKVHAIVLTGGSAYGLDAMNGVMQYLEEQGHGYDAGAAIVPIVTGAVLYDLAIGDASIRPTAEMGYRAAKAANRSLLEEGNYGAGTGASIGKAKGMDFATKSGIGCASVTLENGVVVGAIVAVNALGDVYENGQIIAGMRNAKKNGWENSESYILNGYQTKIFKNSNTTIGVIVTNAKLTKARAKKLAQTTHDAYARCIRPVHTIYDGDAIFAAATGEIAFEDQLRLSVAANKAMEKAIIRAVKSAQRAKGVPSMMDDE